MESVTVMKSFNGSLSPSPYSVTSIRGSSFSRPKQNLENMVDDSEISIFDAEKYFNDGGDHHQQHPRESNRVAPVGAADLERVAEHSMARASSVSSAEGFTRNYRARSFHATPTASSEASWNSQTGLLCNPPGTIPVSVRTSSGGNERRSRWFFGRNCSCAGKKSVEIEEKVSESRSPIRLNQTDPKKLMDGGKNVDKLPKKANQCEKSDYNSQNQVPHWERNDEIPNPPKFQPKNHFVSGQLAQRVLTSGRSFNESSPPFSFPILNQVSSVKLVPNTRNITPLEDPPRDSLEVFRPSEDLVSRKPSEIPRRIFPPNSGAPERLNFTFLTSPKSRMVEDDVASDASSDLFEIESFSTQTTLQCPYNRRDSLEDARRFGYCRHSLDEATTPSIAPTECYEPSEASIDWSVTTAEGFDRGSITNFSASASEIIDDVTHMRRELEKLGNRSNGAEVDEENHNNGGGRRRGNGMLMSCRCEKAVSVGPGPTPVRCVGVEGQRGGGPSRHVSSRVGVVNKPPLGRSHSPRMSLTFAT